MIGKIIKIHPLKVSRNNNIFRRIEFELEDGNWAKTDICPDYRNYKNWTCVLNSKDALGEEYGGLKLRRKGEVDGDSKPKRIFL